MHEHFPAEHQSAHQHAREPQAFSLEEARLRIAQLEARNAELQSRETTANQRIAQLEAELDEHRQRAPSVTDARLNALLAVGAALLVTQEIEPVLDLIVRESTNLFPGTDGALLLLEDPESDQLLLRIADQGEVREQTLPMQQDLTSHSFLAPRAMLMLGSRLKPMLDTLHSQAYETLQDQLENWPPASVLLAPLRDEHRCMGALLLYHSTPDLVYQPYDLPFVQTLADLAAVAITETYQRARAAALQRDLAHIQFLHREAQARLDAAQAQLLQSAKLAAIGELSASVAHEINNPLYAARNSLYLIEQDLPPDSPQRQFLDIAQGELGRIARIITRMRDFYRPSRAEFVTTDVNSLLRDTVEFVQTYLRHGQIKVSSTLQENLPEITAHMDQLRQVFLNVVLNACDAMHNGGRLCITTSFQPDDTDHPNRVVIKIADTGAGIPAEHLEHIFEPFYTTKPQGTGLGLAISAHIVTQHAGQISVDSSPNKGTAFTIEIPAMPPRQTSEDENNPHSDAPQHGGHITT